MIRRFLTWLRGFFTYLEDPRPVDGTYADRQDDRAW